MKGNQLEGPIFIHFPLPWLWKRQYYVWFHMCWISFYFANTSFGYSLCCGSCALLATSHLWTEKSQGSVCRQMAVSGWIFALAKYHRQALRLAGLALVITTNGLPMTGVFHASSTGLTRGFLGKRGTQTKARPSLSGFGNQWSKLSEGFNNGIWTPNCQLFRSDRTCVIFDGISTSSCTPLHCHVVLQELRAEGAYNTTYWGPSQWQQEKGLFPQDPRDWLV